jgi:hypothetical protein
MPPVVQGAPLQPRQCPCVILGVWFPLLSFHDVAFGRLAVRLASAPFSCAHAFDRYPRPCRCSHVISQTATNSRYQVWEEEGVLKDFMFAEAHADGLGFLVRSQTCTCILSTRAGHCVTALALYDQILPRTASVSR